MFVVAKHLGPIWMQSIFEVLEKYYGFTEYFGFQKVLGVWIQQIL
jgi:hypothetical protein